MKKLYSGLAIMSMVLLSNTAFSQEKITNEQIQPVLNKLDVLGKQNPAGAFPLDKLTKDEYGLYKAYKTQQSPTKTYPYGITEQDLKVKVTKAQVQSIYDKIDALGNSPLAFPDHLFTQQELKLLRIYELQNVKPQKPSSAKLSDKAYALDGRSATRPFGTLPLVAPITMTVTGSIPLPRAIYADDIAGDGILYALDNANRNLVRIDNMGMVTDIGPVVNIPAAATLSGLSWNSANATMYATSIPTTGPELYKINLTTGLATLVGPMTGMVSPIWLEIDNAGMAYSIDISTDNLYSVNLATGATTLIGALGVNCQFAQEADFNRDNNVLYMASYTGGGVGGIYTVNLTTGAATLVGDTTPNNAEYTVFSIKPEPVTVLDNAFYKNSYNLYPVEFGTMPLTPPNTLTPIGPLTSNLFADDMAGDGNLYALNNDTKKLVKVYSDGTAQDVGPLTGIGTATVTGLSWNRVNSTMYATSGSNLYTINLTTGAATLVGGMAPMTLPIWLEIDNAGLAYSADINDDKLYSVNLATGATTEIGPLGINIIYAQEADFNTSNNTLYMAGMLDPSLETNLYTVNTSTGAATLVGSTGGREITMFTIADTLPDPPVIPPLTCGDTFLDSGGAAGNYGVSEDITYHFAPTTPGDGVKITFTQVEIEKSTGTGTIAGCWDYLSFYNGPSLSSPVLAAVKCGETSGPPSVPSSSLLVGDSFTSTDPSGELTVRFRSDSSVTKAGWAATVSCASLAVDNINATKFSYYPNPTTGILNLTASSKIESIEVFNVAGQKVMNFAPKSDKSEINLSNLPKGLYFVKATVNGKVITNKVIKK